ncbi:MAG: hypothetical protein RI964_1013 [Pseudomonadota bacterium]
MRDWFGKKLLLHVPLWVCGALFIVGLFLPDSLRISFMLGLFAIYFVARYVWRRYLKRQGKLGSASSGLLSLLFWGMVGGVMFYAELRPHPPALAIYTKGDSDQRQAIHWGRHTGKWFVLGGITDVVKKQEQALLACQYAQQEKLLDACDKTMDYSLDDKPETLEVLVLKGKSETCNQQDCQVWLIQIPADQLAAYESHRENEPSTPFLALKAKVIAHWSQIRLPIQIGAENASGWRDLQINHLNGSTERWYWIKPAF